LTITQFFLQLWADFGTDNNLRNWAEKSPLLPRLPNLDASTVFSEMLARYHQVSVRAEGMIVQLVCREVEGGLRAHRMAATT
jgi:hypothetical protein